MTNTLDTLPEPDMPTTIPDMGTERPEMYAEMTYPENKSIGKAIRQKLRKKDV